MTANSFSLLNHYRANQIVSRKLLLTLYASFFSVTSVTYASSLLPTDAPPIKQLSDAPQYPDAPLPAEFISKRLARISNVSTRTGSFGALDLSVRDISAAFYLSVFSSSENTAIDWTGNFVACDAGDTAVAFKDAVLTRINWYRAMAGVPDSVTFFTGSGSYSEKSQEAALIMSSNNSLSHFPPSHWDCYSTDGGEAASNSNLSLGNNGWGAIDGQMTDNGSNNSAAGHRRWILYPQTQLMGSGDMPDVGNARKANSLWVFDSHTFDSRPSTRDTFVAWPPPGYVPYQVVPPRWSFAYPAADFSHASVVVTQGGQSVDVDLEPISSGAGENTLVWVMAGLNPVIFNESWPMPVMDSTYNVDIENVRINGTPTDFNYQVSIFDPAFQGTPALNISGPSEVSLIGFEYSHDILGFGEAYQMREIQFNAYQGDEGAEDGGVNIIDNTDSGYQLISTQASAAGSNAFHLAHTVFSTQSFEVNRSFVLGSNSHLEFDSRLGWATDKQNVRVQISINDAVSWNDLYHQAGTGSAGEAAFTHRSISLAGYANRVARIRVIYEVNNGRYFPQSDSGSGFYIDNIDIINAQEMGVITLTSLGTSGIFTYLPSSSGGYGLQVQSIPWNGFPGLDWGPIHIVNVSSTNGYNCDGVNVVLSTSFPSGQSVTCTATSQITTNGTVKVPRDSIVKLIASLISLNSGFHAESGSQFSVGQ